MEPKLSSNVLEGPWQVVIIHPTDDSNWHIYNVNTHKYRKIGKVGTKRVNYYDKAFEVARALNKQAQL